VAQPAVENTPIKDYPRPQLSTDYLAPRDATEATIAEEWSKLLGVSPVGVNDNFLESGGHSLLAVQFVARLRELFQVEMTIATFFELPTVSGIAQALRRAEKNARASGRHRGTAPGNGSDVTGSARAVAASREGAHVNTQECVEANERVRGRDESR